MDVRPEIEIEVPDGLKNEELVRYLHKTYGGLLNRTERKYKDTGKDDAEQDLKIDFTVEHNNQSGMD